MSRMPRSCAPAPGTVPHPECSPPTIPAMARPPVLTPQAEGFPRWYQDLISKAELADNGPVHGTTVIRPRSRT